MQHQQIINKLGLNLKTVYNTFIYALKGSQGSNIAFPANIVHIL